MGEDSKVLTWRELKKFANELNEDQLNTKIIWWGDERGGDVNRIDTLKEDHVAEPYESYEAVSDIPDNVDTSDFSRLPKGTPILWVD